MARSSGRNFSRISLRVVRMEWVLRLSAATTWLCKPGASPNPCVGSLQTTVIDPSGQSRVETPRNAKRPKIDCFYVYPTVSNQPTPNATATPDPEVRSIAVYQAQRFSTRCRVYVPLYREVTAAGVSSGIDMALTLASLIAGDDVAQAIQLGIEYDPQPPFDAGSEAKAPDHVVEVVRSAAAQRSPA